MSYQLAVTVGAGSLCVHAAHETAVGETTCGQLYSRIGMDGSWRAYWSKRKQIRADGGSFCRTCTKRQLEIIRANIPSKAPKAFQTKTPEVPAKYKGAQT